MISLAPMCRATWTWCCSQRAPRAASERVAAGMGLVGPRTVLEGLGNVSPRTKMPYDQPRSAPQGYMDLVLITEGAKDNIRAPCSWNLLAKDGVYLMNVPRQVDDLVLAAGNR